ncbi:MAG: Uma2 family endonuclease [Deltaproteobacteria bacterium]|nr:Uma2 family endonuclease [Deltaproteobacteria bacterium]
MIAVPKPRATYADLIALPENVVGEIIDGELHVQPRPALHHASVGSTLGMLLAPLRFGGGGPGGWVILDEPELHLGSGPDVLVPDLAGWRRERMPEVPCTPAVTLAPDWICEVLSPSTAKKDRTKKLRIYAREGISHAWLIDPDVKTLEVYRLEGARWLLVATHTEEDRAIRAAPFEAVELDLALLFSR